MLEKSSITPNRIIDIGNAVCPLPVILTKKALDEIADGQIIKVKSRNSNAKKDIAIWAKRTGNKLLSIWEDNNGFELMIKKQSVVIRDIDLTRKRVKHFKLYLKTNNINRTESQVAIESPITLIINGKKIVTLVASPSKLRDLAIGYLFDEAIISKREHLLDLKITGKDILINASDEKIDLSNIQSDSKIINNECLSLEHYSRLSNRNKLPRITSDYRVSTHQISQIIREFNSKRKNGDIPSGTHYAAIFEEEIMKYYAYDVSRHSAVDKVIGAAYQDMFDFTHCIIITSGRQPAGMVLKAAQMNIPISVSMRGPIYSGILAGKKTGITLIGYANINNIDIYSSKHRIKIS